MKPLRYLVALSSVLSVSAWALLFPAQNRARLEEKHLGILVNRKGTPGLREALKKTKTGAEILLYQDLGL